ncbi:MAG: hypothetical protein KDK34_01120, partial [Leptospiraceae bacterium]|nr:hypothetical protein [Leptospiraceae bacterium]
TGLHADDLRPFLRAGSGVTIPAGLLDQIENVLLPETDPPNVGLEYAWMRAGVQSGTGPIRYVGSKESVSAVSNYCGMQDVEEPEDRQVRVQPYQVLQRNQELPRDRSLTTFFHNGNAQVLVGGSRTYDHDALRRTRVTLDKEYDLLQRALSRRERKCEDTEIKSFLYTGRNTHQNPDRPFLYWNFNGTGLLLNPSIEYHYTLFENAIDVGRAPMAISYSAHAPGFIELLRRKSHLEENCGIFTAEQEQFGALKKIYGRTKITGMMDGSALSHARDVSLFLSRTQSHGVFSYKMSPGSDRMVQIQFPLGGAKQSYKFDFVRPPHDLSFESIHSAKDFKELGGGRLILTTAGQIALDQYEKQRLRPDVYPLVAGREYKLYSSDEVETIAEWLLSGFENRAEYDIIRNFMMLNSGIDFSPEALADALNELRNIPVPREDVAFFNNLGMLLRFIRHLPHFEKIYDKRNRNVYERLLKRYNADRFRFRDWLALENLPVEFHVIFVGGQDTLVLVRPTTPEPVRFQIPPAAEAVEQDPKYYPRLLKRQTRALDKGGDPPGYRNCMDLMERLYEERVKLVEERQRLALLLNGLTELKKQKPGNDRPVQLQAPARRNTDVSFADRMLDLWDGLRMRMGAFLDWMRESRFGLLLIPLVAIVVVGLLFFATVKAFSAFDPAASISLHGDSVAEREAAELVAPGEMQNDAEPIPGEDQVRPEIREVLAYVNVLAAGNGFAPVDGGARGLRDPDLVFPGDTLRLPDGRLAGVDSGEHLFKIARLHYRKDFARLLILDRQITAVLDEAGDPLPADVINSVSAKIQAMERLAVT